MYLKIKISLFSNVIISCRDYINEKKKQNVVLFLTDTLNVNIYIANIIA